MEPDMNKTLLCLIAKVTNVNMIKNYKPIKLCNTAYKLIIKITVNRLKLLRHTIIGLIRASFLSNRRASDNAITVQEFVTRSKKTKKEGRII